MKSKKAWKPVCVIAAGVNFWGCCCSTTKACSALQPQKACSVLQLWKLAQLCNLGQFCNYESLLSSATMKACSVLQPWKVAQFCNHESLLSSITMKACSVLWPWKLAHLCDHESLLTLRAFTPALPESPPPFPLELVNTVWYGNKTSDAPFKPFLLSTFGPLLTMFLNELPHNRNFMVSYLMVCHEPVTA